MSAPSPIQHSSERVLEFDQLRQLLAIYTGSPLGHQRVMQLTPSRDLEWIERQQQLTGELRGYLRAGGHFDFHGLLDPTPLIDKSRIRGAALEITEIRDLLLMADRAAEWREIALHPPVAVADKWQAMGELSNGIADFTLLLRFFRNKILPDGTLDDRASPELARIRREIEKQKRSIQESLRAYLRRLSDGGAVQEELVTIRGERFVIPVKVEQRRRVQGVAHGTSSSGQTVFIEPLETIEQNNELVRLLDEEQAEIHRILLEMTARLGEHADALSAAVDVLSELELQFAKARFAEDYNCVAVKFFRMASRRNRCRHRRRRCPRSQRHPSTVHRTQPACDGLILRNARHPLLERTLKPQGHRGGSAHRRAGRRASPAHHQRAQHRRQNGGAEDGRTAGADGAVGNSAFRPSAPRCRSSTPCSPTSATTNRSSRTSRRFRRTLPTLISSRTMPPRHSLVLLDELGSATDPEEGAALAVAIADYFRRTALPQHHLHPPHRAEGLRGQYRRRAQCRGRLRRADAGADLRSAHRRAGRLGRHQHRAEAGTQFGDCRRGPPAHDLAGAGRRALSRPAAYRAAPG